MTQPQLTSHRYDIRGQSHSVGLAVALVVGLLVNGCCVAWLLDDHEPAEAWPHALAMSALPLTITLAWWALLARTTDRRETSSIDTPARRLPSHGLLVLAVMFGVAAVWSGEDYVRIMRQSISALTATNPASGATRPDPVQAVQTYYRLAAAGGLTQLAVTTIGFALRGKHNGAV